MKHNKVWNILSQMKNMKHPHKIEQLLVPSKATWQLWAKKSTSMAYLVLNICLLTLVKVNFDQPCSIQLNPDAFSNDFWWKAKVL